MRYSTVEWQVGFGAGATLPETWDRSVEGALLLKRRSGRWEVREEIGGFVVAP